jgi:glutamate-1-semialdehyde 2,1-aminomutase
MGYSKSIKLQKRFNKIIAGGSHTYAKGDDQYPEFMPAYIERGKGCKVWDVDDNEYIEYGSGLRSVTLGHAFKPVVDAAHQQMLKGNNYVRPAKIELDYAEEFLSVIDGADMVKFAKNGSDATNGAIRLSRAYTGRDMVAVCHDHPFFSVDDWFIGLTPMNAGIPDQIKKLTVGFNYNDTQSLEDLFLKYPDRIACVILEPEKYTPPQDNFLHKAMDIAHKYGAVFVLDEMITGFRWHIGGAQKKYGIIPDLSTFGKGIANGFSLSALAGKKELMQLGGYQHKHERVFLLSLTHGAENHSIAAALATLKFYKENDVIAKLYKQGERLTQGINRVVSDLDLGNNFGVIGQPCCMVYFTKDQEFNDSQPFRTLFLQETMKRGLLMPSLVVSYSHSDKDVDVTVEKIYDALGVYKKALNEGIEKYLIGRSVKPTFRKFG